MVKSRFPYLLVLIALLITLTSGISVLAVSAQSIKPLIGPPSPPALDTTPATTTTTPPTPELTLKCDVPSYVDTSGSTFTYDVVVAYSGDNTISVNFSVTNPPGWNSTITYTSKQVTSLPLGPETYNTPDSKTINVSLSPNAGNSPDPGSYKLTLNATSGNFNKSIDLTAVIKDKYSFTMTTPDSKLNTDATAGKTDHFTVNLKNTGSAALDNISLTSDNPSDWTVKFSPDKVTSLAAGQTQQEDVAITPPSGKTVAGDYMITFHASNTNVSQSMDVRVTVSTPSIWGIVSIIIIVVVIAGLAVLFLKLGRR